MENNKENKPNSEEEQSRVKKTKKETNKKKSKIYMWLAIVLFVAGLIMTVYPYVMAYIVYPYTIEKDYDKLAEIDADSIKENLKTLEESEEEYFDFSDVGMLDDSITTVTEKVKPENVIGYIKVPSVNMDMPIMYGTKHQTMLKAGGTMKPNMVMGEGNYSIAGHNAKNPNILFAPLHRVKIGSEVIITDLEKEYVYKVDFKEVVMPNRIDVINEQIDTETGQPRKMITLVTCYSADGSDRLIIQGELIEVRDVK